MTNFVSDFFENRGWLGVVQQNPTTGVLEVENIPLVSAAVAAMTDLEALSAVTYDGQEIVVKNPAGNTGNFYPTKFFAADSAWKMMNGWSLLSADSPNLNMIFPDTAWDSVGVFTFASIVAGAQTRINSGGGVHGIAAAGAWKIKVIGGTNWTPGWYTVTVLDSTTDLTIDHPYNASLGQPVFAFANVELEVARIKVPPLGLYGGVTLDVTSNAVGTGNHQVYTSFGVSGVVLASATLLHSTSNTGQFVTHNRTSFRNIGDKAIQRAQMITTNPSGWGTNTVTTATQPLESLIDTDGVVTDLIISMKAATAGQEFRLQDYEASWRY